jgi:hypothetical protein
LGERTTPSAAIRWLRIFFIDAAATPPVQGGDCCLIPIESHGL